MTNITTQVRRNVDGIWLRGMNIRPMNPSFSLLPGFCCSRFQVDAAQQGFSFKSFYIHSSNLGVTGTLISGTEARTCQGERPVLATLCCAKYWRQWMCLGQQARFRILQNERLQAGLLKPIDDYDCCIVETSFTSNPWGQKKGWKCFRRRVLCHRRRGVRCSADPAMFEVVGNQRAENQQERKPMSQGWLSHWLELFQYPCSRTSLGCSSIPRITSLNV